MKITVVKDEKESNERCIARFNKVIQASRKLVPVREERYHSRKLTRTKVRARAIIRDKFRGLREKSKFY